MKKRSEWFQHWAWAHPTWIDALIMIAGAILGAALLFAALAAMVMFGGQGMMT